MKTQLRDKQTKQLIGQDLLSQTVMRTLKKIRNISTHKKKFILQTFFN